MVDFAVSWLPIIVILGFTFVFTNKKTAQANTINQEIIDVNREMIAELREIKQILKDQN